MADLPILFSAPMVRALNSGKKTQTRRALVPGAEHLMCVTCGATEKEYKAGKCHCPPGSLQWIPAKPPRIRKGDWLYVREHWRTFISLDAEAPRDLWAPDCGRGAGILYIADGWGMAITKGGSRTYGVQEKPEAFGKHRQAMHMPRWASRLSLHVTDVLVQRLQDISAADAIAEGVPTDEDYAGSFSKEYCPRCGGSGLHGAFGEGYGVTQVDCARCETPELRYLNLWDHINGAGAADANPWVVAYSFEVHHGNIDDIDRGA